MRSLSITALEAALLPVLLGFGFTLLGTRVEVALSNTLLLFLFLALAGLWQCHKTRHLVCDPKLRVLGPFWLIKLTFTLILLYAGWIPQLDPGSASWGYDPQRYYQESWDLVLNNWLPTANLNYQGVLYYYAAIFYFFGYNAAIPAIINSFITLLCSLFLIRCVYAFAPNRTGKDWHVAGLLLVPEVLWFDVMTSRETLMAILIIVAILVPGRYFFVKSRAKFTNTIILFSLASAGILAIRTSMMIPVVMSISVMAVLLTSHRKMAAIVKVILVVVGIGALSAGPILQQFTGGHEVDYLKTLVHIQSFENNSAAQMEWGEASIGLLLAPNSFWQTVAFLPPRMILYLAAPLPKIEVSISDLIAGSWAAWQLLMTLSTSIFMLIGFPYVLAGTALAWNNRNNFSAALIIPIGFWVTFAAVAGGNIIIHERYRLMFTLLLFACMWFGYTQCSPSSVKHWALFWFGMIGGGAVFYLTYKFI